MALNIPMPESPGTSLLQGLDTGSTMFARLMQPALERARLQQAQDQFQQELALKKAEFARSGANLDLQRQIMQQNLLALQHENDPLYAFNKFKRIQDMITNGTNSSGVPSIQNKLNFPEISITGQSYNPLQTIIDTSPSVSSSNSNNSLEAMKNNPLLRGFFKQTFGFDPLEQTPQEKQQADVNKAVSIDQAKGNFKKATDLENTADTLIQYANNNEQISNLLDRNPNVSGNLPALRNFFNLGGKDAGTFNNLSIPMQGQLAKELSTRGGAVVTKLAQGGKYNLAKSHDYNTGVRQSTTNDIISTYDALNDRYRRLTGNDLPQKLSPFYDKWRVSQESQTAPSSSSGTNGFDAQKFLDYNFKNKNEFINSFNSLDTQSKSLVRAEMQRRGWH